MLSFVNFAVKVLVNVHDLNNEATVGNVSDIRMMEFIDGSGKRVLAPCVSGRMLKHWHYETMRRILLRQSDPKLCNACKGGAPVRPYPPANKEKDILGKCFICDVHGYLIPDKQIRRNSRVMFSWLLPVLGLEYGYKSVNHSRVDPRGGSGENTSQMLFMQPYASGVYGFVSAIDVWKIGLIESKLSNSNSNGKDSSENMYLDDEDRKERIRISIEAYRELFSGKIGGKLSHAIPHVEILEVLVTYSEEGSLPFPCSPIYPDYISKTVSLLPEHGKVLFWDRDGLEIAKKKVSSKKDKIEIVENIDEIFRLVSGIDESKRKK